MTQAMFYLEEASAYLELMENPIASVFTEADSDEEFSDPQEAAGWGAMKAIKKAVQVIIETVKDLIEKIVDFFKSLFMNADDKARYKAFKEMIRKDPALANTKVTIADWRAFEEAYAQALKEAEAASKKSVFDNEVVNGIMTKLTDKVGKLTEGMTLAGSRAAMQVTLKTASEIADQNALAAKAIKVSLDNELLDLQALEKELGDKSVAKFRKRIDVAARNSLLHRFRVKVFRHKHNTLSKILKHQFGKLLSFTNLNTDGSLKPGAKGIIDSKSVVKGMANNPDLVAAAAGGEKNAIQIAGTIAKTGASAAKTKRATEKAIKQAKKDAKELKDFLK